MINDDVDIVLFFIKKILFYFLEFDVATNKNKNKKKIKMN